MKNISLPVEYSESQLKPWTAGFILFAGALLPALALGEAAGAWAGTGAFLGKYSPKLALLMAGMGLVELVSLAGLVLLATPLWRKVPPALDSLAARARPLGGVLPVLSVFLWLAFPLAFYNKFSDLMLGGVYARLFLAWALSVVQLLIWRAWKPGLSPLGLFCGALLAYSAACVGLFYANGIASTPFMLGWSEASRYYNASLWFSRQVYGQWLPLPELHPSRYLLQSIAFLFAPNSIEAHRAWQVFLSLACPAVTAWALAWRIKKESPLLPLTKGGKEKEAPLTPFEMGGRKLATVLIGLGAFVFFFQGPVYYHLILCAFFVLVGFDRRHVWRSLVVVLLASAWAGISRINWYPVPGVLAAVLYLLEEPRGERPLWRYLQAPVLWVAAGLAAAFAANAAYVALSGNPPEVFGSALSSPLLWYRLKPNPTYGPGVLVGSLVLLPVFLAAAWAVLREWRTWGAWRPLGLLAVLAAFYVTGLIVSLKVGGGGDLHNLDNFIVFEAVIAAYIAANRFAPERPAAESRAVSPIPTWALLVTLVLPLVFAARAVPLVPPEATLKTEAENAQSVAWLQKYIDQYATPDRPVLFISGRQLLTFHQVRVPSFEPKYEKVFLMEMAMSGNPQYLAGYVADLKARKFSLIITEPMNAQIQENYGFAEENNLWVKNVEIPTIVRYDKIDERRDFNLAIYVPNK